MVHFILSGPTVSPQGWIHTGRVVVVNIFLAEEATTLPEDIIVVKVPLNTENLIFLMSEKGLRLMKEDTNDDLYKDLLVRVQEEVSRIYVEDTTSGLVFSGYHENTHHEVRLYIDIDTGRIGLSPAVQYVSPLKLATMFMCLDDECTKYRDNKS